MPGCQLHSRVPFLMRGREWRSMFLARIICLLILLLAGCSARQPPWTPPAAVSEEQNRFDEETCRQAAGNADAPEPGSPQRRLPSIAVGRLLGADQMATFDA